MKITPEDFRQRLLPIVLAQVSGLVCGLAGIRLASHLIEPGDYGVYGIFVSLVPLGPGVIYLGLVKFVGRHWQASNDHRTLLDTVLKGTLRKLPWLLAACVLGTLAFASRERFAFGAVLWVSAYLLSLTQLAQAALQATRAHWHDFAVSTGLSVTRSFFPPLLYAMSGAGLRALLAGFLGHAVVGIALGMVSARRWRRGNASDVANEIPARPVVVPKHYEGINFIALATAAWVVGALNRWVVSGFYGVETAGYFTLASNIAMIAPGMLSVVLQQYQAPVWFATAHATQGERAALLGRVDRVAGIYTAGALLAATGLHFVVPYLVGPLISEAYLPAARFVLAVGFSAVGLSVGAFYHLMLLAAKKEPACLAADLSGAACFAIGSVVTAALGLEWFMRWLLVGPAIPWAINRTLARRALFKTA